MTAIVPEWNPLADAFDAGSLIVPGINKWLGKPDVDTVESELAEGYEAYCERISRTTEAA